MRDIQIDIRFPEKEHSAIGFFENVPIDNSFPENEANELAEIESFNKHLFRPNSYLHKWWARRSGTTFRYILKQLVSNQHYRDYYSPGGLDGITILDPMMGGGTTLHEAIRLGANVVGYDIDPIPVLQTKVSLTDISYYEKQDVFKNFMEKLRMKLSQYFKTKCPECGRESEIQFVLYGARKLLNNNEVIVVDSLVIRVEQNDDLRRFEDFYPSREVRQGNKSWSLIDKKEAKALGIAGKKSEIITIPFSDRYIPLVIVGDCGKHCRFLKKIDSDDLQIIEKARKAAVKLGFLRSDEFSIHPGPKSDDLLSRNIHYFYDLFFPRQLLYLAEAKCLLDLLTEKHILWMSLLISTSLEFNSTLCGYKGINKQRPGAIRHVFSHHAYSFPFTSLENNPVFIGDTSGTLNRLFKTRILAANKWAREPIERRFSNGKWKKIAILNETDFGQESTSLKQFTGKRKQFLIQQNDSSKIPLPDGSIDFIVTDPPYLDSVQYSDLSHFFRCWLRWFLPKYAKWDYLVTSSAVAETRQNENKFGEVLTKIWQECYRVLARPHGRLIFTFHYWRASAWIHLSNALSRARFRLLNAYVVHSENPISVHIMNLKSLKHDTILVLKPEDTSDVNLWQKPDKLSLTDSYDFCKGCAQMLGWVLENRLSNESINQTWEHFLRIN